ncbi:intercompartmental signaling factor BofC [Texcoconibacillus texcoconensis]|uniref:Forespore regulator of the sigma-K checkpoint n=1 Tax=Texcoconibacillus texcoconensis TaxID=1095777 RepID=A0A840QPB5_9BACI|nr:intercompartmental signaling factor BofC [Texcoconibacillus texcoconensis]MBB5173215.1 forespore regulator of the sigma-K checkpoint [Texcoconibacillus texcoconensis]
MVNVKSRKQTKWIGVMTILLIVTTAFSFFLNEPSSLAEAEENESTYEIDGPKTVDVVLQRVYIDGEVSEETIEQTIWSMEDFWAAYNDWQLVEQSEEEVVFQQEINDLSPVMKINGHFGISQEGVLHLYNGQPENSEAIQSFFQIDTERLKSHQFDELQNGIPIFSKEDYLEVINELEIYEKKEM